MAEKREEAKKSGAKKEGVKKKTKSALYETKGDALARKNKFCPKCGAGVFMAEHKDRLACGKCGYAEWKQR
ncbi:MAG: 30S ribosomal protein S27ae [Candidatus Diapherotrites archaeon]|uniref:Small ribosomal subunit protein eS31 n=1 Tax=Candidatus Iainarchaeum sp. TaxID=3101447 RepID=A0A7J4JWB8_9ARCH|nr:MAG: 30S ribosomal protein S27ae, small subunit ribosomal protein S27Ae [archaeon GW2011_AR21]MBS3058326.1 30S ribosomal protein S27ae [Candidatus Diapherotrites archaeon]HIH22082.1 30S ribosomal protein S27ae [Candidatus Diapherotrites archaeon]